MPAILDYEGEFVDQKAYDDNFGILKSVEFENPSYSCYVQNSEVDINGHLNNTRYADYILNAFPSPVQYSGFEISYSKEAVKGDKIDIGIEEHDDCWIASGKVNGEKCFNAKLIK
jgi:acyl-ACP thioesterase